MAAEDYFDLDDADIYTAEPYLDDPELTDDELVAEAKAHPDIKSEKIIGIIEYFDRVGTLSEKQRWCLENYVG